MGGRSLGVAGLRSAMSGGETTMAVDHNRYIGGSIKKCHGSEVTSFPESHRLAWCSCAPGTRWQEPPRLHACAVRSRQSRQINKRQFVTVLYSLSPASLRAYDRMHRCDVQGTREV